MKQLVLALLLSVVIVGCANYKTPQPTVIEQPKEIAEINLGGVSDGVSYIPQQPIVLIPREIEQYVSPNDPKGYREPMPPHPNYSLYGYYGGGYYQPPIIIPVVVPTVITIWQGTITVNVE